MDGGDIDDELEHAECGWRGAVGCGVANEEATCMRTGECAGRNGGGGGERGSSASVVGCSSPNCVVELVVVSEWKCQIVMEVHCANRCEEMVVELLGMTGLVMAGLAMTVVKLAVQLVVHHLLVVVNSLDVLARVWNGDEGKEVGVEVGEVVNQIHVLENAFHDWVCSHWVMVNTILMHWNASVHPNSLHAHGCCCFCSTCTM